MLSDATVSSSESSSVCHAIETLSVRLPCRSMASQPTQLQWIQGLCLYLDREGVVPADATPHILARVEEASRMNGKARLKHLLGQKMKGTFLRFLKESFRGMEEPFQDRL